MEEQLLIQVVEALVERSASMTFFRVIDVPVGIYLDMIEKERPGSLTIVHMPEVRPYRPLPLFRADTIC